MSRATLIQRNIAKGQLVPFLFTQDAVADSQAAVAMNIAEVAAGAALTVTEHVIPWEFELVGISVVSNLARLTGTLTVDATINGTVTGLQAALDATNTTRHHRSQVRGSDAGAAGDRIGVKLTTASWTDVASDIAVVVYAILSLEGI